MVRWLAQGPDLSPRLTPGAAARVWAWVVHGAAAPDAPVAHEALFGLLRELEASREASLRALADTLTRSALPGGARVGLPPRLASALFSRGGAVPGVARAWVGDRQAEGGAPDGAIVGEGTEWWADGRGLGAAYGERLWAWGTVAGPHVGWVWRDDGFVPTPALVALADRVTSRPRIERGPGLLAACVADATADLVRGRALTHRDAAAVWGGFFLPILAPARVVAGPPVDAGDLPPDYAVQLAFHLLHPRARAAVQLLDQLATWADAGDVDALATVLGREGTSPGEAVAELIAPIARAALARDAAAGWDGGLGFRLVRRVLRAVGASQEPARAIDLALHGPAADPAPSGPLAERLREAFGTALAFADRGGGGAATSQLVDLVLLRWTDPAFEPGT